MTGKDSGQQNDIVLGINYLSNCKCSYIKLPNNLSKTNHQLNLINKLETDEERKNIIVYDTKQDMTSRL